MKVCALLLGMHNSGTSLAASLLQAAAVPMGPRLLLRSRIPEQIRPAYDYFEDLDAVELQDHALALLGRHWSSHQAAWALPEAALPRNREVYEALDARLAALLQSRLAGGANLWALKDPRTAVLLPCWMRVLERLGIQPRFLVVHRDPAANVASFSRKGQVPPRWAEALWQRTYSEIFRVASAPKLLLGFEELRSRPGVETERMLDFLGHTPPPGWRERAAAAVRPELGLSPPQSPRRSCSPCSELLARQLARGNPAAVAVPAEEELLAHALQRDLEPHPLLELASALPPRRDAAIRKRVALLTPELQGIGASGGIGTAFLELALALREAGHEVKVLLVGGGEDRRSGAARDVPVEMIPAGEGSLETLGVHLKELVEAGGYDVVHVADWLGLSHGFASGLSEPRPLVICGVHGPTAWVREGSPLPLGEAGRPLLTPEELERERQVCACEVAAMAGADLLVSPSLALRDWLRDRLPAVLRADRPALVQLNPPSRWQAPAGVPLESGGEAQEPGSLIFFGRLERRKGIELFLEALERLAEPPAGVHFIGADVVLEGESTAAVAERRLQALGLTARFHHGLDRDRAHALVRQLGGVVVIPSLIENSPYAIQEFLGSGVRVVATAVGGIPELVVDPHGRLAAPEPAALARCLEEALGGGALAERFRLEASVRPERIRLGWQAFHGHVPPRLPQQSPWPPPVLHPLTTYPDGILLITLDSCRYDTFRATATPQLDRVGSLHRAQAPSHFTYGSHAAMFMGFLPGITAPEPFLNSKFAKVFRLGHAGFQAGPQSQAYLLEGNSIVTGLRRQGYTTIGTGAVNCFDPSSESGRELSKDFDHFWYPGNSWSLERQLEWIEGQLRRCGEGSPFVFLNVGETHVPYWHEDAAWSREDTPCWPFQTEDRQRDCRERQAACLAWVDRQLGPLLRRFLEGTVIVCADHGDCWGEDGLWEHGVSHPRTLEVPLQIRLRGVPIGRPRRRSRWEGALRRRLPAWMGGQG